MTLALFTSIRGQVGQPHDVRHAGRGDLGVVSKLGLVLHHAVANGSVLGTRVLAVTQYAIYQAGIGLDTKSVAFSTGANLRNRSSEH